MSKLKMIFDTRAFRVINELGYLQEILERNGIADEDLPLCKGHLANFAGQKSLTVTNTYVYPVVEALEKEGFAIMMNMINQYGRGIVKAQNGYCVVKVIVSGGTIDDNGVCVIGIESSMKFPAVYGKEPEHIEEVIYEIEPSYVD
jgi:hypothetical protein